MLWPEFNSEVQRMTSPHQRNLYGRSETLGAAPRRSIVGALILLASALSSSAYGADYGLPFPDNVLRGSERPIIEPPSYPRWEGFYFGGQAGRTFMTANFGNATSSLVSYILANTELQGIVSTWTTLPELSTGGTSYGGFIGYNLQWGDVITGFELNANHMALNAAAQDTIGPLVVPGATQTNGYTVQYDVGVVSSASVAIHNIVTARARAGWTFNRLLPYAFAGLAVGQADIARSADVFGTKTLTPPSSIGGPPVTGALYLPRSPQSESKSLLAYGFTAGLGVDVGVLPNMFLRAEWEFVQFPNISDFRVSANSVHVGVGLKF